MKHPVMSKQQHLSVKVPALDGGVNYTDMPYDVQDNQLTECKNMWWHKGALRTRPGVVFSQRAKRKDVEAGTAGETLKFNGAQILSEQNLVLTCNDPNMDGTCVFYAALSTADGSFTRLGGVFEAGEISVKGWESTALVTQKGENYYVFLSDGSTPKTCKISGTPEDRIWSAAEPYAPLVMMNGKGSEDASGEPATTYEGHNRLTGAFRCQYSTDGKSSTFYLPKDELTHLQDETVYVTLSLQHDGKIKRLEFKLPWNTENAYTSARVKDIEPEFLDYTIYGALPEVEGSGAPVDKIDLTCYLDCTEGYITFSGTVYYTPTQTGTQNVDSPISIPIPKPAGMETNNLEIKVWKTDPVAQAVIGKMTQSTWFGGDRSGVNGGTRLFVAGNPDEPNLVCWSDLNNPLYFPENNFVYVGDANQAVTSFGKQADALIIFKEHEIYSAQYVAGNVTRADDVTTQTAQFPITPVHSTIGCDCPGTIRLVNNQLVWLSSNGHVYTLPTVNQYDENNVRDISLLVQDVLQKHTKEELKKAVAGEYMGYYLLAVGNRIYMMNAECGAFASVHYYSSKERAQRAIPWYVWELDTDWQVLGIVSNGEKLSIECTDGYIVVGGNTDNGEPIPCSFTTKAFNFGQLDKRKAVNQLYLSATAQSPLKMRLSYITDRFTAEDAAILEGEGDSEDMTAENYKVYRVTPNVHRVGLFGLRVDCDGAMAVNGLTIKYKNEGVTR